MLLYAHHIPRFQFRKTTNDHMQPFAIQHSTHVSSSSLTPHSSFVNPLITVQDGPNLGSGGPYNEGFFPPSETEDPTLESFSDFDFSGGGLDLPLFVSWRTFIL